MRTLSVLVSLLVLTACTGKNSDSGDSGGAISSDDQQMASDLWTAIADHDTWATPDGWSSTPVLSGSHSGTYVVTYLNPALAGWDSTGTAPEGSIAVKDGYADADGTTLSNYTVMLKSSGYDSAGSDWFWAEYAPDGTVSAAGKVSMCSGCHQSAPHDYLYTDPPTGS